MSKTIIITGASRGIGRAIALQLAGKDINIIINCVHNLELLNEVRDEIIAKGACCTAIVGDVSKFDTAAEIFDTAHRLYGKSDILINNAGISHIGLFQDLSPDEWNRIMNVNLGSVYNCCHFAVKDMLTAHNGKIINISSVWGSVGASCEAVYSASKGAVNAFTKALAKELAPSNIQVNAVACGAIDTDMNRHFSREEIESLRDEIPAGRMGNPSEVARTVRFLCEAPEYLTGQIITLDGGWT